MSDNTELKKVIEDIHVGVKELRERNDSLQKNYDGLQKETIVKINGKLDELESKKDSIETAFKKEMEELKTFVSKQGGREVSESAELKAYKQGFSNYVRKGYMKGFNDVALRELEAKALTVNNNPSGGFFVTPEMGDIITTRIFEGSPIRQLANVVTTSSDSIDYPLDNDEVDSGWVGETGTRTETDTNTVGMKNIPTHEQYAEPRISQKLLDDAQFNIEGWLQGKIADKFARTEGSAFISGNGVCKPKGMLDSVVAPATFGSYSSTAAEYIVSTSSANITADSLIKLVMATKDAYQTNGSFLMSRLARQQVRLLKDSQNRYLWEPAYVKGEPSLLLGKPLYSDEEMPDPAADSYSVVFGDIRSAYTIVDRIGIRTLVDNLTTKGFVKYYTTKRVGGDVVNYEAFKVLKLGTS